MDVVNFRNAVNVLLEDAGKHRSEDAAESWQGLVQLIQTNSQIEEDVAYVASVLLASKDSLLQFLVKSLEQQGDCKHESAQGVAAVLAFIIIQSLYPATIQALVKCWRINVDCICKLVSPGWALRL